MMMSDHTEQQTDLQEIVQQNSGEELRTRAEESAEHVQVASLAATEPSNGTAGGGEGQSAGKWRAEAGRKGARRVHQLIQRGLQYEREHGLKRGRQRLRQLIQEGKLYEQEHGLESTRRPVRTDDLPGVGRGDQLLATFLRSLLRMAKPAYRRRLVEVLRVLEGQAVAREPQGG
jgi:hypothetical protein